MDEPRVVADPPPDPRHSRPSSPPADDPPDGPPPPGESGEPPPGEPIMLRFTTWSLVRAVLIVAGGLVGVRVAVAAGTMLWWLAIATAVAGAFHPAVTWLRRWLPAWAAIVVVLVAVLGLTGFVGYRGVAELAAQLDVLRANALDTARSIETSRQFGQVAAEFGLVEKTTDLFDALPSVVVGGGRGDTGAAATVQSAASSGSALFAVAMFVLLMLIFASRFVRAGLEQVDDPVLRRRVGALVIRAYHDSYRYVWMMVARAVVAGVLGGLLCAAVGIETPTALGVGFAALSIIPGLGILLAAIPVAVYAAVSSISTGVVVIGVAAIVQAMETALVQRRIDAASVHVGPTATLVSALVGLELYGVGGVLVCLAVAVYGLAVLSHLSLAHDEVLTAVRQLVGTDRSRRAVTGGTEVPGGGAEP